MVSSVCGSNQVRSTWWRESHGLGLIECCWLWEGMDANVPCRTKAEHYSLHLENGPQGAMPTWLRPQTRLKDDYVFAKETGQACQQAWTLVNIWGVLK